MRKYHMISAKRMGWEKVYDYLPFPIDEFSKEEAMAKFKTVEKETLKNNGRWYSYKSFEYEGTEYHDVIYSGIVDEREIINW